MTGRRLRIDSRRRWFPQLRETAAATELLYLLSKRQLMATYRQTVLGSAWIFLSPILSAGLFTFVFGRVAHLSSGGNSYFAFSYASLLAWNIFADTLVGSSKSLVNNSPLISKIYFPRLILPLSVLAPTFIELAVSLCVMFALLGIYGIGITWHLALLPVWLLLTLVLSLGIGVGLAALSVPFRDVNSITPALVPLFLFITPVAYSAASVPASLRPFYLLNPVATLVEGSRWSLLGHGNLHVWSVSYSVGFTVLAAIVGLVVFARLEGSFADVI